MQTAKKGDWVQIHKIVLESSERAPQLPDDTKKVPLEMWVKGYLKQDAIIGEIVEVETATGRSANGKLTSIYPSYSHDYGEFVPELQVIDRMIKGILFPEEKREA
ncbi:MAG: 2-amino-4-oxopentanoate thiolase subunit OrtA [Syntrophothermus sp.]